jgi:hypothetical protein
MKIIRYVFLSCEINHGTEENPDIEQVFADAEIECANQAILEANMQIAENEAVGEITVVGEFDAEPETTDDVLNALLGV